MEASSVQQYKEKEPRVHRPFAFDKMEELVREMQDPENGVPVRSQKQFLTSIPSAFMGECQRYLLCGVSLSSHQAQETTIGYLRVAGYDLIEWLMERLNIEESVEAVHIANQLCQYGYFFPVNDSRTLTVKDDSSLYRFQSPYYWPWQHRIPDNIEYAIYLTKRTLRNKQRHGLEEYEMEAFTSLKKNLQNRWTVIQSQAEEQVRLSKERKKGDKIVGDSQERAFWRVYRPPPGCTSSLEVAPIPARARPGLPRPPRKRTLNDLQREVDFLRNSLTRTRVKVSVAIENFKTHFETYMEYDPMMAQPQPSNPWITDDQTFWQLNSSLVEVPTEKRVKRWAISMEELMSDPTGLQEFTNYLRKEYSHENIRFWLAVKDLRHSNQAYINDKVNEIFREFLAPGAPCEINIDGKTMERVHQEMKNPSRFTFDAAAEHVYTLLLKKDCYPRFVRSDHYRNLMAAGIQPLQKKRFFAFGGQGKKKISTSVAPASGSLSQQQQQQGHVSSGMGGRRRGSDRSLSGSAHELAVCGVRDTAAAPRVPHSHSQSNLTDIPYRDGAAQQAAPEVGRTMDDVCPWDAAPAVGTSGRTPSAESEAGGTAVGVQQRPSRKNSSQLDSCSSSSDVSVAVAEVSERLRKQGPLVESSPASSQRPGPRPRQQQQQQPQQHQQHQHHHQHHQAPAVQRNYSVGSAQPASGPGAARVRLAETARASVSTCNFPSPQQSFDLSCLALGPAELLAASAQQQPVALAVESSRATPPPPPPEQLRQSSRPATGKAPLISISAIVGELPEDLELAGGEEEPTTTDTPDTSSDCALMSEPLTQAQSMPEVEEASVVVEVVAVGAGAGAEKREAVANVAEEPSAAAASSSDPPGEQHQPEQLQQQDQKPQEQSQERQQEQAQQAANSADPPQDKRDNNVNEVCPWEDEENCRVDAPYVKTYATLGYL
ncbi:regulator of G-protein signaling 9 isoform X2 [Phymastichus coffea]|uniref:regulator of G-protein signaling 9 isoform X2 n=1 Tax=Phymastichus coffea TaxID=108790 RepID=UPI00273B3F06|nr:regulator of G-protein signaling 9 isoform X2 [Phymastichus coffea]